MKHSPTYLPLQNMVSVSGQLQAPADLRMAKNPGTHTHFEAVGVGGGVKVGLKFCSRELLTAACHYTNGAVAAVTYIRNYGL